VRGLFGFARNYRFVPEPGPVGASVDPLGEAFGASVFPDGFMVLFGVADEPLPMPVVPDVPVPVPTAPPVVDGLELMPVPAEPPAAEPAPPPLCAKTTVLDSANAVARAIVVSFIGCFLSACCELKQLAAHAQCSQPFCRGHDLKRHLLERGTAAARSAS
jgi:hypothetical protein